MTDERKLELYEKYRIVRIYAWFSDYPSRKVLSFAKTYHGGKKPMIVRICERISRLHIIERDGRYFVEVVNMKLTVKNVIHAIMNDYRKDFIFLYDKDDVEGSMDLLVSYMNPRESWYGFKAFVVRIFARLYIKYLTHKGECK